MGKQCLTQKRDTKAWNTGELTTLRNYASLGAAELAEMLGRSVNSVRMTARRYRISLRRANERRGLVLGQPRGYRLAADISSDIRSGHIPAEVLAQRTALREEAGMCPCCGRNPATVRATGFCRSCHLDRMTSAHLDILEEHDAQRALWTSRQALCRTRRRERAESAP